MTIREHAAYPGTRIVVPAFVDMAHLQLRLNETFGDPTGIRYKVDFTTTVHILGLIRSPNRRK
jgi:hypothetical protein